MILTTGSTTPTKKLWISIVAHAAIIEMVYTHYRELYQPVDMDPYYAFALYVSPKLRETFPGIEKYTVRVRVGDDIARRLKAASQ